MPSEQPTKRSDWIRVRARGLGFAVCSFGFSFTEYMHGGSVSMWCVCERNKDGDRATESERQRQSDRDTQRDQERELMLYLTEL